MWVEGLPDNADVHNTRVTADDRPLRVTHASNGQVNAAVPEDMAVGDYRVTVAVGRASDSATVKVV
jgi:uncharacterized protein (TIGR03437 family)